MFTPGTSRLLTCRYARQDQDQPGRRDGGGLGRLVTITSTSPRSLPDARPRAASPRTTCRYDRSRANLDRSPGYLLAGYISRAR